MDGIKVPTGSHEGKKVIIGADHRGFAYKNKIIKMIQEKGYEVNDVGTHSLEKCDYPPISNKIGRLVSEDPYNSVGIGICGSGIGSLIPASKHSHIYVARCVTPEEAATSRRHNNTNVLGIGADIVSLETALEIVDAWLTTPFYEDPQRDEAYLRRYTQTVKLETELRHVIK